MTSIRIKRRGAALLVVLGLIVVTTSATVGLVRTASVVQAQRRAHAATEIADDLAIACDSAIRHWLEQASRHVVLPPDNDASAVLVLADTWADEHNVAHEVTISAWDQCGMVPLEHAHAGSPLRLGLPDGILRILDQAIRPTSSANPGLDLFVTTDSGTGSEVVSFPTAAHGDATRAPAIGALVATHNAAGRFNVNTALPAILEAALRAAGRGGLDVILQAREMEKLAPAMATTGETNDITPVNSSDAWAFRIDLRVESVRRSWWIVYRQQESSWECVQRLDIVT